MLLRFQILMHQNPWIHLILILIINTFRKTPLNEREPVNQEQIDLAKKYDILIITTETFLKVYELFLNGNINGESITNVFKTKEVTASKWVLPFTGITILMKELLGADLERLRMVMQANDARSTLQIVYDNIVSPKPSFDKWLNSIAGMDYEHLFMAVYVASFNGSNHMPIDCTNKNCKEKSYITDDIPFTELVSYKDDTAKAKFMKLYKEEPSESKGLKAAEIIAISEDYAIGLCVPTLYGAMIEPGYFTDDFIRKHASVISLLPYIDKMYVIDNNNKQLVPIEYKDYPLDPGKTAKSKAVKYGKIFATLTSDEITTLRACVQAVGDNEDIISYKQPSTTCPHCGHQNPEVENVNPSSLVFLRNQLGLLMNT